MECTPPIKSMAATLDVDRAAFVAATEARSVDSVVEKKSRAAGQYVGIAIEKIEDTVETVKNSTTVES